MYKNGSIKIENYEIFEKVREYGKGGGFLTAVHYSLSPVLVQEEDSDGDIFVVNIIIMNENIHIINGYGPQEDADLEERMELFINLKKPLKKQKQMEH